MKYIYFMISNKVKPTTKIWNNEDICNILILKEHTSNFILHHKIILNWYWNLICTVVQIFWQAILSPFSHLSESLEGWSFSFPVVVWVKFLLLLVSLHSTGWMNFLRYGQGKNLAQTYVKHSQTCLSWMFG